MMALGNVLLLLASLTADTAAAPDRALAQQLGDPSAWVRTTARGTLRSARGRLGTLPPGAEGALRYVTARAALLGLRADETLTVVQDEPDAHGNRHVRLTRALRGVPVDGDQVRLHAGRAGLVHALEAEVSDLTAFTLRAPKVSPWQARDLALQGHTGRLLQKADTRRVIVGSQAGLAVAHAAWRVRVARARNANQVPYIADVYVDAMTGGVLLAFPRVYTGAPATMTSTNLYGNQVTLNVTTYDQSTLMQDTVTVPQSGVISTANGAENNVFYSTASTSSPFTDATGVTVHDDVKRVFDQYGSLFNYRNWNFAAHPSSEGGLLLGVAHQGEQLNNAFFTTFVDNGRTYGGMFFGDGDGSQFIPLARCFDVAGHEMGHGVVEGTAGLVYQFQSGALNEHFADVFGWLMDQEDNLIGEDCVGQQLLPALRDMCNPGNVVQPQPGHMNDFRELPNTEDGDYGGVHINSGIPNRAACLARDAVGAQKMGQVWFQALRFHLGNSSTFAEAVSATATSCSEVSLPSTDCDQIASAWVQVGLGTAASGGSCPANASMQNGSCFCNDGFRPDSAGTGCEAIPDVSCPANSHAEAGSCYCDSGFVPDSAGTACVSEQTACPSHSHRENSTCVCDECYQGNPNGNGQGCDPMPSCAVCTSPLEDGNSGSCQCIPGISQVCGPQSMSYTVTAGANTYYGEQCCRPGDPCGWGNDGACDCFGECSFEDGDCASTASATPVCAARTAGDCGNEVWAGRCVGEVLIWCDDRTDPANPYVNYADCTASSLVCGEDLANGGYNCVAAQNNCGAVPPSGQCDGNTGRYCDNGVIQSVDCGAAGCGSFTYQGYTYQFCFPCPEHATYNGTDETCYCDAGYAPNTEGTLCVSDGSSSGGSSSGGSSSGGSSSGGSSSSGGAGGGEEEESSCRCAAPGSSPGWLAPAFLALVLLGRRRR